MCKANRSLQAPGSAGSSAGKCHRPLNDEACAGKMPPFAISPPVAELKSCCVASPCSPLAPARHGAAPGALPASSPGANPDCSCLCLLPQMANPVPSACCVVLAAVVVVYAQRHSQQGESCASSPARGGPKKRGCCSSSLSPSASWECCLRLLNIFGCHHFLLCLMCASPPAGFGHPSAHQCPLVPLSVPHPAQTPACPRAPLQLSPSLYSPFSAPSRERSVGRNGNLAAPMPVARPCDRHWCPIQLSPTWGGLCPHCSVAPTLCAHL